MKRLSALAAVALCALATPAAALPQFGARGGFTRNPDQVHLGAHAEVPELGPGFLFVPNVEVGLGDDQTVWAFNAELIWTVGQAQWRGWRPYVGGGAGLFLVSIDAPSPAVGADGSRTDVGVSAIVGAAKTLKLGHKFFTEIKLGLEDAPDVKFTAGLTFY